MTQKRFSFWISKNEIPQYNILKEVAKEEGRSVSNLIKFKLFKDLKKDKKKK